MLVSTLTSYFPSIPFLSPIVSFTDGPEFTSFYIVAQVGLHDDVAKAAGAIAPSRVGTDTVLCRIRAYPNGTFDMLPGISPRITLPGVFDPTQWYFFRTPRGSCFRYRIEFASEPLSDRVLVHTEDELVRLLLLNHRDALPASLSPIDASSATLTRATLQLAKSASGTSINSRQIQQQQQQQQQAHAQDQEVAQLLSRLAQVRAKKEAARREDEARMREALARIRRAGADFTSGPVEGTLRYSLFGEIASAEGFDCDNLYVEYRLQLPEAWAWSPHDRTHRLGAVTHTSRATFGPAPSVLPPRKGRAATFRSLASTYGDGGAEGGKVASGAAGADAGEEDEQEVEERGGYQGDYRFRHKYQSGELLCCSGGKDVVKVHHIGHPVEMELLHASPQLASKSLFDAPTLLGSGALLASTPLIAFSIYSVDWADRHRVVGSGFVHLPSQPGSHTLRVETWRSVGSLYEEMAAFFIGGGPRLRDIMFAAYPPMPVAKEMGLAGKAGGWQDMVEGGGRLDLERRRQRRAEQRRNRRAAKAMGLDDPTEDKDVLYPGLRRRRGRGGQLSRPLRGRVSLMSSSVEEEAKRLLAEGGGGDNIDSDGYSDDDSNGNGEDDDEDGDDDDEKEDDVDELWLLQEAAAGRDPTRAPGTDLYEREADRIAAQQRLQTALGAVRAAQGSANNNDGDVAATVGADAGAIDSNTNSNVGGNVSGDDDKDGGGDRRLPSLAVSTSPEDERDQKPGLLGEVRRNAVLREGPSPNVAPRTITSSSSSSSSSRNGGGPKERDRFQSRDERTIFFNRYGLRSEASGSLSLMFNVVITLPENVAAAKELSVSGPAALVSRMDRRSGLDTPTQGRLSTG